jgi:LysR family transcriptional activator of nhaA
MEVMNFKHLHYFWQVARLGSVARAAEQLHLTPHTISAQIASLEDALGVPLFARRGRRLELTDAGRTALGFAQDIFALGSELEDSMRSRAVASRAIEFRVGVSDAVPKAIAYRLLEPATRLPTPVRMVCREWKLDSLLAELAAHRLDVVIATSPIPGSISVNAYNHRLGESTMSFFANPAVRKALTGRFPACLDGAPMLLPGSDTTLRSRLDRWCTDHQLRPRAAGEFDDSALMKAFGQNGAGVFIGPTVLEREIEAQYHVKAIGRSDQIVDEYFAISVQRRVTHPCVGAITGAARNELFAAARTA